MKTIKGLILGSAAGLLAISGAQAADLPVKAKAVEYVKVCSLYGAGFFYIPGTDTCVKLGGYLRVDSTFNGGTYDAPSWNGDLGQHSRYASTFAARSRMALTVDTRTATEYGVVRTFAQTDWQFTSLNGGSTNPATVAASTNALDTPGGGYVAVEMVFIQFAGFTFGKSASAFATPWHGYPGNNTSFLLGGHDTVTGVNNVQYTAQFGNGVSATVALEDALVFNRTAIGTGAATSNGTLATNIYGGQRAPDVVGNIRVDQAWGLFQVSGALHNVNASYYGNGGEAAGHPDSKWGGAVSAALQIKNLPTGAGDDIKIDVTYAKGNTKQVISTSAASPSFVMYGDQGVGFGYTSDGIIGSNGQIELTEAFGVRGAFNHNWDAYWSSSLFGSYSAVRYNNNAKATYCPAVGATIGGQGTNYSCNPDFNVAMLGFVTRWTPVKNLAFSAEVLWVNLHQNFSGVGAFAANGAKPAGNYTFKDQDTVSFNVRAQRNF